jgi:hypothetical protein
MKTAYLTSALLAISFAFSSTASFAATPLIAKQKVVFQMSDADPGKWNLVLNNVKNVQQELGADKTEIEIVVYGPGIGMLKIDSTVGNRVEETKKAGVAIVACQNTMKGMKLTEADMLTNTNYVSAGVVEIIQKQKDGYAYIRP